MRQQNIKQSFKSHSSSEIGWDLNIYTPQINKSSYFASYQQFFEDFQHLSVDVDHYLEVFTQYKIRYNKNRFFAQPVFNLLYHSQHESIVSVSVAVSYFQFQITILNKSEYSITHKCLQKIGHGGMGSVYLFKESQNKQFAIKRLQFCGNRILNNMENRQQFTNQQKNVKSAVLECCFTKLFSALNIGPKFHNVFGFDIIVYKEAAQFSMELCKQVEHNHNFTDLKQSLKIMHHFKIIHGDIKPDNIMWSGAFGKLVFVDFGLSRALNQDKGQLTQTPFFGSYFYTSKEMKCLFKNKSISFVDLYYNDVNALLVSEGEKFEMSKQLKYNTIKKVNKVQLNIRKQNDQYEDSISNTFLQYLIFQRNVIVIKQIVLSGIIRNVNDCTMQILFELGPWKELLKVASIFASHFKFDKRVQKKILLFLSGNELSYDQSHRNSKFAIRDRFDNVKTHITDRMLAVKLLFNQDISYNASKKKYQLIKQITKTYQINDQNLFELQQFWKNVVSYVGNLYTSKRQVQKTFQIVKRILKIEQWDYLKQKSNTIFSINIQKQNENIISLYYKAKQIIQAVYKRYNINICTLKNQDRYCIFDLGFDQSLDSQSINFSDCLSEWQSFREGIMHVKQTQQTFKQFVDIFRRSTNATIQKDLLAQVNQILKKLGQKQNSNGSHLYFSFIKIVIAWKLNVLTLQQTSTFQNYFVNYNIDCKSRMMIEVALMELDVIKSDQGYEEFESAFSYYLQNSYNYCFSPKHLLFVLTEQLIYKCVRKPFKQFNHNQLYNNLQSLSSFVLEFKKDQRISFIYIKSLSNILLRMWKTHTGTKFSSSLQRDSQIQYRNYLMILENMIKITFQVVQICSNPSALLLLVVQKLRKQSLIKCIKNKNELQIFRQQVFILLNMYQQKYECKQQNRRLRMECIKLNTLFCWKFVTEQQYLQKLYQLQLRVQTINKQTISLIYKNILTLSQHGSAVVSKMDKIEQKLMDYLKQRIIQNQYSSYNFYMLQILMKGFLRQKNKQQSQHIIKLLLMIGEKVYIVCSTRSEIIFEYYSNAVQITNLFANTQYAYLESLKFMLRYIRSQLPRQQTQNVTISNVLPMLLVFLNIDIIQSIKDSCLIPQVLQILKYIQYFCHHSVSYYQRRAKSCVSFFISLSLKRIPQFLKQYQQISKKNSLEKQRFTKMIKLKTLRLKQFHITMNEMERYQQIIGCKNSKSMGDDDMVRKKMSCYCLNKQQKIVDKNNISISADSFSRYFEVINM